MKIDEFIEQLFEWKNVPISQRGLLQLSNHIDELDRYSFSHVIQAAKQKAKERHNMTGKKLIIEPNDIEQAFEEYLHRMSNDGYLQLGTCPVCGSSQEVEIENPIDLAVDKDGVYLLEICMNPACNEISPIEEWLRELP